MAPLLHETLGRLTGVGVRYTLYDLRYAPHDLRYAPHDLRYAPHALDPTGSDGVRELLETLTGQGVRGVNITHPFKQLAAGLVNVIDPTVVSIGAVNTIRLQPGSPVGHNTDHSGLLAAYRRRFPTTGPGVVALLGAGGVGRAAAFALASLGATAVRLHDPDRRAAVALGGDITAGTGVATSVHGSPEQAAAGADGVLNCSPIGMHSHPGCPIDPAALDGARWVFDAVYSPVRTELLIAAERQGIACLSGTELFLWQGVHAFEIFVEATLPTDLVDTAATIVRAEVEARAGRNR